jgi:hypothetical protein
MTLRWVSVACLGRTLSREVGDWGLHLGDDDDRSQAVIPGVVQMWAQLLL